MGSTQVGGTTSRSVLSGWVTFAGVMAAIVGLWNGLSGIAAITEDDQTEVLAAVLYGIDISTWGWFWLVVGIIQVVTAGLIFARNPIGQILGVMFATISASLAVFAIFAAPIWALAVLTLNMAVIWALIAFSDEFGTA